MARTLHQKHEFLKMVDQGVMSTLGPGDAISVEYRLWPVQILVKPPTDATGARKMSKADGASLADIIAPWKVSAIDD